jgi:hypothetical protein
MFKVKVSVSVGGGAHIKERLGESGVYVLEIKAL